MEFVGYVPNSMAHDKGRLLTERSGGPYGTYTLVRVFTVIILL